MLSFERAGWEQDVQLDARAARLTCRGARFGGRADLNVRWAEIALDDTTFLQRSRLAGVAPFQDVDDGPAQVCRVDRQLDAASRPRLLSLRQADVENLALGSVDLRACCFFGARARSIADRGRLRIRPAAAAALLQAPPDARRGAPLASAPV